MRPETDYPTDLRALERDYELIRELGQGGMAAVYLARRRDTGELVAIKAVRGRYLDDPEALRRFAREARTVAELNHPNIVRTEAIEQIGDRAVAIIVEYVPGGTVRDRLREYGAFGPERAEGVLRDVANALAYAHRRGIVHRDVKPENVFLDERTGRALLSDFGIARRIEGDAPITLLGSALGTPQYMSPEQVDGGPVDGRSDIYSLGVLGWELLTGQRPWAGENLYSIIYKQKHEQLPRITSLRPRIPANLLFAIEGALIKDRNRRWQSAEEFLEHLTYDPPPLLSQSSRSPTPAPDDAPTVKFRPAAPPPPLPPPSMPPEAPRAADERRVPNAIATSRRRRSRRRRDLLRGLAFVVPLAIAGGALYVVFGGTSPRSQRGGASVVTSSSGSIALDSARTTAADSEPTRGQPAVPDSTSRPQRTVDRRDTTPARPTPVGAVPPAPTRPSRSTESGRPLPAAPSSRCAIATMADQRACLMAYVGVIDAPLQRVYDSLIGDLRRAGGAGRGAPDPPAAARLRTEQRAWIGDRDRECTRRVVPGSVSYWAKPLAQCFAERSAAREAALRQALRRSGGGSQ